jgi:hypothetical protein
MPEAAISRDDAVDYVLPAGEIPALLISLTRVTRRRATASKSYSMADLRPGGSWPTPLSLRPDADDARSVEN